MLRKAVRVGPQTSRITVLATKHEQSDCVDARMTLEMSSENCRKR